MKQVKKYEIKYTINHKKNVAMRISIKNCTYNEIWEFFLKECKKQRITKPSSNTHQNGASTALGILNSESTRKCGI